MVIHIYFLWYTFKKFHLVHIASFLIHITFYFSTHLFSFGTLNLATKPLTWYTSLFIYTPIFIWYTLIMVDTFFPILGSFSKYYRTSSIAKSSPTPLLQCSICPAHADQPTHLGILPRHAPPPLLLCTKC